MNTTPLNISFRRAIVGQKLIKWNDLILRLANITLSNEKNCFVWSLHKNGYLHVFLLAPLLVYDATTGGAGYYAQWCYTLGIGSQGSLIPLWVA
uniref:Reverse transcriptase zinc-binding domain-containing protein n=1 Tax=Oryza rufipogon TaxID=4529 RepID=A0A0E0MW42_ORYRU